MQTNHQLLIIICIVANSSCLGAVGALVAGTVTDKFGRKFPLLVGAAIATVGCALQTSAQSLAMMLVGRIVAGLAIGVLTMSVPLYNTECSHPKHRGFVVGFTQQMIGFGYLLASWLGYGTLHCKDTSQIQWRVPIGMQLVPSVLLFVGMFFLPESPRFLVAQEKYEEAHDLLVRLHYDGTNMDWIEQEFAEIREVISAEKNIKVNQWMAMFCVPQWRRRMLLATGIQAFGQTTGINVIVYYQTIMYRGLGLSDSNITLISSCYMFVGPTATFISIMLFIDRVGRRRPLIFGTCIIVVCLACEGIVNSQNLDGDKKGLSGAGIFFIWFTGAVFSMTYGPMAWTYMTEVMPMQIRGPGVAVACGIGHWGFNTMWSQVSPKGLGKIGWKFYFVFVAANIAITIPCLYFFYPETKGIPLEEMDNLFGGPVDYSKWSTDITPVDVEKNANVAVAEVEVEQMEKTS